MIRSSSKPSAVDYNRSDRIIVVVGEVCCYGLWLFGGFDEDFFWDEFMAFLVLLCMEVGS